MYVMIDDDCMFWKRNELTIFHFAANAVGETGGGAQFEANVQREMGDFGS